MSDEYSKMLATLNEIVNELKDHNCKHEDCCVKSLLEEIEFKE
jgi:hypothetical protein